MAQLANRIARINSRRSVLFIEFGGGFACILLWIVGGIVGQEKHPGDMVLLALKDFGGDFAYIPVLVFAVGLVMIAGKFVPWQMLRSLIRWTYWPYLSAIGLLLFGYAYEAYQATENRADWRDPIVETLGCAVAIAALRLVDKLDRSREALASTA